MEWYHSLNNLWNIDLELPFWVTLEQHAANNTVTIAMWRNIILYYINLASVPCRIDNAAFRQRLDSVAFRWMYCKVCFAAVTLVDPTLDLTQLKIDLCRTMALIYYYFLYVVGHTSRWRGNLMWQPFMPCLDTI